MTTLVLIGFLGGLITGISPCILPVLPVIFMAGGAASARPSPSFAVAPGTGISLGGTSGAQEDHRATRPVPRAPSKWRPYQVVAGLVLSFTAFTLLGSTLLTALHLPQDFIRWAGVVLLVLIGVGMIVPRFMHVLEKPFAVFSKAGRRTGTNGFGLGIVLGAAYVPCAGPVLAAVSVAGSTGRIGADTVALALSFAAGTAIPLLAFALSGRRLTERVSAFSRHQRRVRIAAGATVLALAAGIVTDLPAVLQRALPDYTSALQRSADPGLSRGGGQRSACVDGATTLADCGALPSPRGSTRTAGRPPRAVERPWSTSGRTRASTASAPFPGSKGFTRRTTPTGSKSSASTPPSTPSRRRPRTSNPGATSWASPTRSPSTPTWRPGRISTTTTGPPSTWRTRTGNCATRTSERAARRPWSH